MLGIIGKGLLVALIIFMILLAINAVGYYIWMRPPHYGSHAPN